MSLTRWRSTRRAKKVLHEAQAGMLVHAAVLDETQETVQAVGHNKVVMLEMKGRACGQALAVAAGEAGVEVASAEPIELLEVNENTVSSGVLPLHFGPAPASGIPYPSVIVGVTPDEFKKIEAKELNLPDGWENWEELPRPRETAGAA